MKVVITGAGGQLARALAGSAPAGLEVALLGRSELDLSDPAAVAATLDRHGPDLILNAGAYTAVDRAESEADAAHAVNRDGPAALARWSRNKGARLAHVSTDFVFNGQGSRAYRPDDPTEPLGVYGASKLAGEIAVSEADPSALILRTAWVYDDAGKNFLNTMLRLMNERDEIRVVADQIGTPTAAHALAEALWTLALSDAAGVFHFTDSGVASWYDFALAIAEEASHRALIARPVKVTPIRTEDYPTPAARPAFSVLDKTATYERLGGAPPHWRVRLREVLDAKRAAA
jgi:dTDP-4-dehydrorhamnose reductase